MHSLSNPCCCLCIKVVPQLLSLLGAPASMADTEFRAKAEHVKLSDVLRVMAVVEEDTVLIRTDPCCEFLK